MERLSQLSVGSIQLSIGPWPQGWRMWNIHNVHNQKWNFQRNENQDL